MKKGNLKALKHRDRKLKKLFAHYWIFHSDSFFPQSWKRKVLHLFSSHWSLSYIWITNVLFQHITAEKWKTKNLDVSRTEVKFFTSLSWINWNSFIQPKANISFRFSNDHIVMPCLIVLILYYSNLKICASAHFVHNNKCGTK